MDLLLRTDAPREDVHAVLSPDVYNLGLVKPSFQTAQVQISRGMPVRFKLLGHTFVFKWWVWHRTYHVLIDSDVLAAADYIYDYVK